MLVNLSSAIQVASGGDIGDKNIEAPELRALLENFVSSSADEIAYATLLNADAKGISAGRIPFDAFLQRELERAYSAARDGRAYNGQALVVGEGKSRAPFSWSVIPCSTDQRSLGMIASVVDLQFLIRRLRDSQRRWTHSLRCRFPGTPGRRGHSGIRDRAGHEEPRDRPHLCRCAATRRRLPRPSEFTVHNGTRASRDARHLQSGDVAELGGRGAEAAARSLSRRRTKCSAPRACSPCWRC